jgi:hypothetical protein
VLIDDLRNTHHVTPVDEGAMRETLDWASADGVTAEAELRHLVRARRLSDASGRVAGTEQVTHANRVHFGSRERLGQADGVESGAERDDGKPVDLTDPHSAGDEGARTDEEEMEQQEEDETGAETDESLGDESDEGGSSGCSKMDEIVGVDSGDDGISSHGDPWPEDEGQGVEEEDGYSSVSDYEGGERTTEADATWEARFATPAVGAEDENDTIVIDFRKPAQAQKRTREL